MQAASARMACLPLTPHPYPPPSSFALLSSGVCYPYNALFLYFPLPRLLDGGMRRQAFPTSPFPTQYVAAVSGATKYFPCPSRTSPAPGGQLGLPHIRGNKVLYDLALAPAEKSAEKK